ncbi:MAG TPA: hypothetical protein DD379_08290 [Cyanobacteria bacterium UBA11162]|nr:hypothetical protein [Cyanobacteria bacterium UBA11162]
MRDFKIKKVMVDLKIFGAATEQYDKLLLLDLHNHLQQLTNILVGRILEHPLLHLITNIEIAKFFVGQYLHFAFDIPRITGIRYGLCQDESIRRRLLSVMMEEDGYTEAPSKSHHSLALLTATSLGIKDIPTIHVSTATILAALEAQYKSSLISGIASSYAREGIYPKLMPKISQQLLKASTSTNTIFFDIHATGDVEHSKLALECLCQLGTKDDIPLIEKSVYSGLGFLLSWYDSLYMEIK